MSDEATGFVGSIPENYDHGLGPVFFADYAEHTARLVANYAPSRVLETGAGTGIVTRRLRDLLPATTRLIATDLNPPMLDVARKKFTPMNRSSSSRRMLWHCRLPTPALTR
jgi:predicted O-methyltransferase YrrM